MVKEEPNPQKNIGGSIPNTGEPAKLDKSATGSGISPKRNALNVQKIFAYLCKGLNVVGIVVLVIMTFLTVVDVTGRYLFSYPILGSTELTEYFLVAIVFLCVGWCAVQGKMVVVDLVLTHLPKKVQAILNSITLLIGLGVLAVVTWQSSLETIALQDMGKASALLKIPAYPAMWIMTVGFAVVCLVMVLQIVQNILKVVRNES